MPAQVEHPPVKLINALRNRSQIWLSFSDLHPAEVSHAASGRVK